MFQQQSLRWLDGLRAPRIGIGALGLAVGAAFAAGALFVSLLVGGASTATRSAAPVVSAPGVAAPHSGPSVGDFGTPPQAVGTVRSAPVTYSGPSVGDFGTPPAGGSIATAPVKHSGRSVADFGTPPAGGTIATAPQRYSGPSVGDFGTPPSGN